MVVPNATEFEECSLPENARVIGVAMIILIMILGTIGNLTVCVVLCILSKRNDSTSYTFVKNVAISDLMTSLTVLPFDILYWLRFPVFPLTPELCRLWNAFFFTFLAESSVSLCMVTFDIFLAVTRPLHYSTLMTPLRVNSIIACSWAWSLTVGTLIYIYQEQPPEGEYLFDLTPPAYGAYLMIHIGIPSIIIPILYLRVLIIAKTHASKIEPCAVAKTGQKSSNKLSFKKQLALAKMFFLITVGFFICWYPFFVVQLFYVFGWDASVDWCQLEKADTIVCWFAYVQCCLNPIFYAFRRKDVRRVINRSVKRNDKTQVMTTITRQAPTQGEKRESP